MQAPVVLHRKLSPCVDFSIRGMSVVRLCLRTPPSHALSLRSVHTLQNPSSPKVTSKLTASSSESETSSGNQRQSLAITTLPLWRAESVAAHWMHSGQLPSLSDLHSSQEHRRRLLLHLTFTFTVSLNQTCQQSFQPLALSPHVNEVQLKVAAKRDTAVSWLCIIYMVIYFQRGFTMAMHTPGHPVYSNNCPSSGAFSSLSAG